MNKFTIFSNYLVDKLIWGWPLIIILLLMSLYFGFKTRFAHLRYFFLTPKLMFEKNDDNNKVSSFQAMSLILANQVGTGNIIGVSIAILYGGPGAIFWMWVTAIFGSSLSFIENTLAQIYKVEVNKEFRGGPAYYILKGLKSRKLANTLSVIFFICLGFMMPTIQSATIATSMNLTLAIPKYVIGLLVAINLGFIIVGKAKKIVEVSSIIVPIMSIFYLLIALIIILVNFTRIDDIFILISDNAFNQNAIFGSIIASAISHGVRRGLFSHEAGLGSTPNTSASGNVKHPVHQGLISSFCVFIDTIVICTASAFIILITDSYNVINSTKVIFNGVGNNSYMQFVAIAINSVFNNVGTLLVSISLLLFGFMSLLGGFYNGQTNLIFMFKNPKRYNIANKIYKLIFIIAMFLSSIFDAQIAWKLTDIAVGIASLVNVIVIFFLRKKVFLALTDFENKLKNGDDSYYVNDETDCWKKRIMPEA
jgi:AGCS family alanine or glycine:cation symporter